MASPPLPTILDGNPMYKLERIMHGGRGLVSLQDIPENILLHICAAPYAYVIFREFRKEVCGTCFAYAFDGGRNTWNFKSTADSGVWFCSQLCLDSRASESGTSQGSVGLKELVYRCIEKHAAALRKESYAAKRKGNAELSLNAHPNDADLSADSLEKSWNRTTAEIVNDHAGARHGPQLSDYELETARCVASALVRRFNEDSEPSPATPHAPGGSWLEYMQLQDNELAYLKQCKDPQASHRIYKFLRRALPADLQPYVATPSAVREMLARDDGNAFGIFQCGEGESEMFGWGVYVSGSYFNHNCSPNVRKERVGRAFHFYTSRAVQKGEELCISYVDVNDPVLKRKDELMKGWYFDCSCSRCESELGSSVTRNGGNLHKTEHTSTDEV